MLVNINSIEIEEMNGIIYNVSLWSTYSTKVWAIDIDDRLTSSCHGWANKPPNAFQRLTFESKLRSYDIKEQKSWNVSIKSYLLVPMQCSICAEKHYIREPDGEPNPNCL